MDWPHRPAARVFSGRLHHWQLWLFTHAVLPRVWPEIQGHALHQSAKRLRCFGGNNLRTAPNSCTEYLPMVFFFHTRTYCIDGTRSVELMIASAIIAAFSMGSLLAWFRYSCGLILSAKP